MGHLPRWPAQIRFQRRRGDRGCRAQRPPRPWRAGLRQARHRPRRRDDEHQRREGRRDRRRHVGGNAHGGVERRRDHDGAKRPRILIQPRRRYLGRYLHRARRRGTFRGQAYFFDPANPQDNHQEWRRSRDRHQRPPRPLRRHPRRARRRGDDGLRDTRSPAAGPRPDGRCARAHRLSEHYPNRPDCVAQDRWIDPRTRHGAQPHVLRDQHASEFATRVVGQLRMLRRGFQSFINPIAQCCKASGHSFGNLIVIRAWPRSRGTEQATPLISFGDDAIGIGEHGHDAVGPIRDRRIGQHGHACLYRHPLVVLQHFQKQGLFIGERFI
mmetsp:Transcript_24071/g.44441  ORF Transcript_24071/g.44441 Transcript_24071/m.44441 type:complete len:326 (-) Transcript_24071:992-1969(-)